MQVAVDSPQFKRWLHCKKHNFTAKTPRALRKTRFFFRVFSAKSPRSRRLSAFPSGVEPIDERDGNR